MRFAPKSKPAEQSEYLCGMPKKRNIVLPNVLVEDYAAEGKSLARVDGKVIFIEDAVPGDVVDVRLSKNKKDWGEGRAIGFSSYSKDRVQPFCQHFGVCGGCQWQMLPYSQQLLYKEKQVKDTLARIGKVHLPPFEPILGAQPETRYRNKLEYTFSNKRYLLPQEINNEQISSQQDVAGYHAKGLFDKVVDIQECHLQHEPTNEIRLAVKDFALQNNFSFYNIREHRGFMRTMQVRLCRSGEIMVNIVLGEDNEKKRKALTDYVLEKFPALTTLLYTINTKKNDSMHDLHPVVVAGKGYVIEKLENFSFKIGPKSFFQTNTYQGERLYQVTREYAELTGSQTVYDLYCGTGSIGIFVSAGAKGVIGVELVAEAVEDARQNALINNISHAEFFTGDVTKLCNDEFFERHGRPDVIITDPPRAGMTEELCRKILDMEAPIVVYVSCNPATQARDLSILGEKYHVTRVRPVDMFPHTHHIENVVQLKLK
jgi:23S rRNA (uracil1939-C5)-methyltransferase